MKTVLLIMNQKLVKLLLLNVNLNECDRIVVVVFDLSIFFKLKERFIIIEEREDSDPRYVLAYTRFPGVPLRPLGHLSKWETINFNN